MADQTEIEAALAKPHFGPYAKYKEVLTDYGTFGLQPWEILTFEDKEFEGAMVPVPVRTKVEPELNEETGRYEFTLEPQPSDGRVVKDDQSGKVAALQQELDEAKAALEAAEVEKQAAVDAANALVDDDAKTPAKKGKK